MQLGHTDTLLHVTLVAFRTGRDRCLVFMIPILYGNLS